MAKTSNKKFNISIEPVSVCDAYEVGNWTNYYPFLKFGYKVDNYETKISDISFCLKDNGEICGYFMAYNFVNVDKTDIIPLYSKKLVLYDCAISARAYARCGVFLINFLINYAKNNGYMAIEIKKVSKYGFFLNFLSRHFKLEEFNESYYILINLPKIKPSEKHLTIYDEDSINIEDLYFLYDLNFSVGKKFIKLKLNDKESITIDRTTAKIKLPTNVEILNDELVFNSHTKGIIFLICEMYETNCVTNLKLNFSISNPQIFEAYANDVLYINKDFTTLRNDIEYVLNIINKGITHINSYVVSYDMNERTISHGSGGRIKCEELIKKPNQKD